MLKESWWKINQIDKSMFRKKKFVDL